MLKLARVALIASGNDERRHALVALVRARGCFVEVIACSSLSEARRVVSSRADVALAMLDGQDFEAGRTATLLDLRLVFPGLRVVVIAATDERDDVLACLQAGAHGYLPADLPPEALAAAVARICEGGVFVPSSLSRLPAPKPDERASESSPLRQGRDAGLTARQNDVLGHLRAGRSNRDIAHLLHLAENTVKVHTHTIFRKLGISRRKDLIDTP
ncbi:DNA-binding NarL/FixJ family response regulator [Methylobacterium sp. BE186]|uniref:response regulator transcription factor n=1 Tax=Methylobacterium sp. BE186 TaxID=2817715 RepID=UPI00285516CE|nr:response regulator transcription factor [Methylobacterium sp. BE186]MDR7039881.1 DNA-binding NarL/FixJ family response regulator [Methylobacterium sp. BE186]